MLVVDDDPDQVIVRCMVLSHHGFETRRAGNAEEALRAVRETVPDAVVVDLGLPSEQDGLRLIGELKEITPSVPVVVLTGSNIDRLRPKPELAHAAELIQKGSSCKALLGALDRISGVRAS